MSRFGDYYDDEFNNQGRLWWANCERALKGRKGKAALAELREAMLALPEPVLIAGRLANEQGQVCAVGAMVVHRRVAEGRERATVLGELARLIPEDENCDGSDVTATVGVSLGFTYSLAYRLAYENDEGAWNDATPEARYDRLMRFIDHEIGPLVTA